MWHLSEQICRKAKLTVGRHNLFQVKKQRAPVHKGPHKHSLHGPVFQTRHWVGHTRSCDVRTLQNMDPWWGMRKWEVEGLMCSPEEQYFCCYSRWPVLSYSGKSINKLHSFKISKIFYMYFSLRERKVGIQSFLHFPVMSTYFDIYLNKIILL